MSLLPRPGPDQAPRQRTSPPRGGDRRHTVGAVKSHPDRSLGDLPAEVNGDERGFQADLRRLIDPDFTEEDIRNKVSDGQVESCFLENATCNYY